MKKCDRCNHKYVKADGMPYSNFCASCTTDKKNEKQGFETVENDRRWNT